MAKTFFTAAFLAAALTGCSLFSQPTSKDWTRASGGSDQTAADLSACRQEANAVIKRDADIDSDIAAARSNQSDATESIVLPGVDEFEREQRYDRIVNNCMRQRGYVLPEKKSIFE
jgi:hypothetical protein